MGAAGKPSKAEGSSVAVSYDVGRRCGWDLVGQWLWGGLAGAAPIRRLAWELLYAAGTALKRRNNYVPKTGLPSPPPSGQPQAYFSRHPSVLWVSNADIILGFSFAFTSQSRVLWVLPNLKFPLVVTPFRQPAASCFLPWGAVRDTLFPSCLRIRPCCFRHGLSEPPVPGPGACKGSHSTYVTQS